jgi:hypothetical protein
LEVAVICIFGGYQFVRLRRIIDNKQNNWLCAFRYITERWWT